MHIDVQVKWIAAVVTASALNNGANILAALNAIKIELSSSYVGGVRGSKLVISKWFDASM